MIFKAKDYLNRKYLELAISSQIGCDVESNKFSNHKIEGTREELKKLNLDDTRTVFGLICVITDTPTSAQDLSKPLDKKKLKKIK